MSTADNNRAQGTWLTAGDFARAAYIGRRAAQLALAACHAGGTWRGHRLDVVKVPAPGLGAYMVAADSLPADVTDRFKGLQTPIKPDREPVAPPDEWGALPPVRSRAAGKGERGSRRCGPY